MKKTLLATLLFTSVIAPAVAYQKGDILIRGGATAVVPEESTSTIVAGGSDLGVGLSIDSNTQLGLNLAYFVTDQINIELLAATPFKHDVNFDAPDPLGTGDKLGEVKHLPPTLSVNYYFNSPDSYWQPYAGVGINYTFIYDESFTDANEEVGLNNLSLDNSLGLAAQVGVDYKIDSHWYVNSSVRWIDIDTEASFALNNADGNVSDISIDPWVYTLAVGYVF
ncbi:outer membrane beta-barrel protein [Alteromonas pelagimontana]|uniref:Outer membrane beta-barrel protein n=1 Tax=Alteromonas pelagimontana TaxID=1858656 RepID=A0A6M4MD02_9ALTE|nr:OmpW family outer membrane protein [Alteromonas pelagimontana]QJR81002.1 outer membrane beta-barrel protein [Alteromonas pelagimontana]